jgi:hypothetical protein
VRLEGGDYPRCEVLRHPVVGFDRFIGGGQVGDRCLDPVKRVPCRLERRESR